MPKKTKHSVSSLETADSIEASELDSGTNFIADLLGGPPTELEELTALYETMKEKGVNSIGDVEVKLSRLQK